MDSKTEESDKRNEESARDLQGSLGLLTLSSGSVMAVRRPGRALCNAHHLPVGTDSFVTGMFSLATMETIRK